jgi:hypothetical protein
MTQRTLLLLSVAHHVEGSNRPEVVRWYRALEHTCKERSIIESQRADMGLLPVVRVGQVGRAGNKNLGKRAPQKPVIGGPRHHRRHGTVGPFSWARRKRQKNLGK